MGLVPFGWFGIVKVRREDLVSAALLGRGWWGGP